MTAAQSLANLKTWLDSLAVAVCKEDPLVCYSDQTRAHGVYHRMRQAEHTRFIAAIARHVNWSAECVAANLTCGKLLSIEAAERGTLTVIHIPGIGCFV